MLISGFLTLYIVPAIYTYLSRNLKKQTREPALVPVAHKKEVVG
jgi:hypothetical protein